ncbi:hypothetical protein FHR83_004021 [Actinoplanes campanulatus]|uniref:Secreted protein n=1 Tax=Actinoplanes campanulatus TaxID=113559 RepID=A0A7W5AHV6_9ACTN|nr:hypothetical protein [Actinoplanes campanulatus]MBB3096351.1 hypothetical protein [Actinoplanes campanulatus]GGN18857.1 hypothetical protein GCM10010109_32180 [Actinoplanes campanulatus]GID38418.1 hypothetical protein Aca09nite_49240 [Actinoplanes campanulatus]
MKKLSFMGSATALALAAVAVMVPSSASAAAGPTTRIIERSGCLWTAENWGFEAETHRSAPNDCAGHAWVQIKVNNSWSAWKHDYNEAKLPAPSGQRIQQSRHKTCTDCAAITLNAPS